MFLNQQEERLFQGEDALALEWDFIEQNRVECTEQKSAKIVVMMNNQNKTIHLCKSTLTMEYSLMDLRKKIIQEFQLPNKNYVMKIYSNRGTLISNDLTFKQILESSNLEVELHINLSERKHCLLCMKSDCYHLSQKNHTAEKKRKMSEERVEINFLEPQILSKSCGQESQTDLALCKKRKVASCTQILKNTQNLLVPQNGTFIF